jgi:hypothetical protein
MPQPVKLSDTLIATARKVAANADRSLARQIEHWSALGRAVESMLNTSDVLALKRTNSGHASQEDRDHGAEVAAALVRIAESKGRHMRGARGTRRRANYASDPALPGLVVRINDDGSRTPGRIHGRRFIPMSDTD